MKSYEASATIDASPDAIWKVLTDAPAYAAWDSGVERVEGTLAPGGDDQRLLAGQSGARVPGQGHRL